MSYTSVITRVWLYQYMSAGMIGRESCDHELNTRPWCDQLQHGRGYLSEV